MTGILLLREIGGASGGGGALGALAWNNIYGPPGGGIGVSNTLTIAGVTGPISLTATITGGGELRYGLNHVLTNYAGPIAVTVGDTLDWIVENTGFGTESGTISVHDGATLVDSFTYIVYPP